MNFEYNSNSDMTYIIFGYSGIGKRLCDKLLKRDFRNIVFCDNSVNKINEVYKGIGVLSVKQAISRFCNADIIICSIYHENSMKEQLISLGVDKEKIFLPPQDLLDEEQELLRDKKMERKSSLSFEVDIAMNCNLKCKSCHHFSPLAEREITNYDTFERDFRRLSSIFGNACENIYLLGGEPLLNKDVTCYLKTARQFFPNAVIELLTNGLLLKSMSEIFWTTCREENIQISVTKYPIKINYSEMKELASSHNVNFKFFGSAVDDKHMSHYPLDLEGKQNVNESYYGCNMANNCVTLKNGKLYTCTLPPNIVHFNKYYDKNLVVGEQDGIDIYSVNDKDIILDFLSKPIPFCRYCKVSQRTYDNQWELSKFRIEEWT